MFSAKSLHHSTTLFDDSLGDLRPALALLFGPRFSSRFFKFHEKDIAVAPIAQRMPASSQSADNLRHLARWATNPNCIHDCLKLACGFSEIMDRFTVKPPHNFLEGRFELAHSLAGVALELLLEFFSGVQNCPRSSMRKRVPLLLYLTQSGRNFSCAKFSHFPF